MLDVLCIAHDTGGARVLSPLVLDMIAQGLQVRALASGPAESMWSYLPVACDSAAREEVDALVEYIGQHKPRLLLTGTSHFADLERNSWLAARQAGVPSVGAIDAWVNFSERFVRADGTFVQPDYVCVIDEASRSRLAADPRVTAKLCTCGQPHLEALVASLLDRRLPRQVNRTVSVVFFSNPVAPDPHGCVRPYDQFSAAGLLLAGLGGVEGLELLIKPHPRENFADWERWIAKYKDLRRPRVFLTYRSSEDVLVSCDGVCGITSMALVEGSLLGLPVLSLQPGRVSAHNQVIDELDGVHLAVTQDEVPRAIEAWLADIYNSPRKRIGMPRSILGSRGKYLGLIERLLGEMR